MTVLLKLHRGFSCLHVQNLNAAVLLILQTDTLPCYADGVLVKIRNLLEPILTITN